MSRDCPICDSAGPRELLHRQRFLEGPLGEGYDVVICGNCGAGFADGIPSQEEMDRYYAERSKYVYDQRSGAESPYDLRRFEHIVAQLAPWVPQRSASILDVGCATGGLLARLAAAGYTRLLGCDPSPACAAAARRLHGVEVLALDIGQLVQTGRHFDVILMVGVFEHLHEVGAAVDGLAGLLNPGGLLYCAQPDAEAFASCMNAPYQQFSTEHVVFFSEASLNRLMAEHGFEPGTIWRWMTEWREGMSDSVVSGIYRRSESGAPVRKRDEATLPALRRYLEASERQDRAVRAQIDGLVASGEPILVWGAGTFTRRLLADTALARANIAAFIDVSRHLQGETLAGRRILGPGEVSGRPETIVVASRAFRAEIGQTIRTELRMANRIVCLG